MKSSIGFGLLFAAYASCTSAFAIELVNPGFEQGFEGWTDGDPTGAGTAISNDAHTGDKSVKLTEKSTFVTQVVPVQPGATYRLSAFVRDAGNVGVKVGTDIFFEQQKKKGKKWRQVAVTFNAGGAASVSIFASYAGRKARFDDFELALVEGEAAATSTRIITRKGGGYGLSPDLPPGKNFELVDWYLNTPADDDRDGKSDRFSELQLVNGAVDERYFYTADDGGMVFRATVGGAKTSKNTKFTRTELREMLRRGNKDIRTKEDDKSPNGNNWVFSSAPEKAQKLAGGVDGTLRATLAVNHVTTTGDKGQVGRVIVGQIHAAKDEPIRLYYRKLPGNKRGSIYAMHEPSNRDDIKFEMIGSSASTAPDPENGIALDEKFSYEIDARGNFLDVTIRVGDEVRSRKTIDMTDSGYDIEKNYMYFKAGVYNQNNTGDPDDYAQATFYELENSHDGYAP